MRPAYLQAGYFVQEIASVFFLKGHFVAADRLYREAARLDPDNAYLVYLLADANLLSGSVVEARDRFDEYLSRCTSPRNKREAELKLMVCDHLIASYRVDVLPRRKMEANQMLLPDGSDSSNHIQFLLKDVDALHPITHFNFGVMRSREGIHDTVLQHFLCCAFVQSNDIEASTNAAICGLNVGDETLLTRILSTAIYHLGANAYDSFRAHLEAHGIDSEELTKFDEAALKLLSESESEEKSGFTIRMLNGDGYQVLSTA